MLTKMLFIDSEPPLKVRGDLMGSGQQQQGALLVRVTSLADLNSLLRTYRVLVWPDIRPINFPDTEYPA